MWQSGDTLGGKGAVYNPSEKATHAVIWMHGLGDTCDGWATAMQGPSLLHQLRPVQTMNLQIDNLLIFVENCQLLLSVAGLKFDMPIRFIVPTVWPTWQHTRAIIAFILPFTFA